ncbi:hypothetical protein [Kitasatospora terrestris]|uniref:DUF4352 domain-containing protein n=1 Tax=Kitasatospora terrestris TaxID=258051 RepID=A0ABP9DGA8_9ACTN
MRTSPAARPVAALAATVLVAALATACDDLGQDRSEPAPVASATASAAGTAGTAAGRAKTVQLGRTVYKGGLKFDVATASYQPGENGDFKVVVDTTVTNTFKTSAVRDWPDFALDIAGTPVRGDYGTAVPPTPSASNRLPLTFAGHSEPGHPFAFDGTSLVLGDAAEAQAVLPLGTGGREAADLKPVDLTLPGTGLTSGRLTLTLKTAQLRADFGDGAPGGLQRGQRALFVVYDMKGNVGPAGMAVAGEVLRLKLPNGQEVGPSRAPIEAIYPDHPLYQDQAAWFVFSGAGDGDYTLTVTDAPSAPGAAVFHATGLKASGPLG